MTPPPGGRCSRRLDAALSFCCWTRVVFLELEAAAVITSSAAPRRSWTSYTMRSLSARRRAFFSSRSRRLSRGTVAVLLLTLVFVQDIREQL